MPLTIHYKSIIKSPSGRSITNEFCGEHHMGADHNEFILSDPVLGVKRFFTTNGQVLFNDADLCFYIYEPSTLIIRIHSESWQASCLSKSQSEGFEVISQELLNLYPGGGVHQVLISLYSDENEGNDEVDRTSSGQELSEVEWKTGLGTASEGVFPNAWTPFVDEQESKR